MKKTFGKIMVALAIVAVLTGGIIVANGQIDPPLPTGTVFRSK